ncbi:hypothetical protein C8R43DRAFT_959312 [Mycena crocata]|nr:hypothetical protein C8R43DRAFT_959312 [Mycena crocata]
MAKTVSSGNKRKKMLEDEEKLRRHRKAQSKYYAGNPEIRVRRLEQAAGRKEAAKLKKRRWDRPKQKAPAPASVAASQVSGDFERFSFKDPRAHSYSRMTEEAPVPMDSSDQNAAVGTGASPTSEEFMASHALAQLAGGVAAHVLQDDGDAGENLGRPQLEFVEVHVNENAVDDWRARSVDSILEMANQLTSVESHVVTNKHAKIPLAVRWAELPPAVSPLTRVQEAHLQITGEIGPLTAVQAAQLEVAKLSSSVFLAATPDDAVKWRTPGTLVIHLWDASDWTKKETAINQWRRRVHRQVISARTWGEAIEGLYEVDLEEGDFLTWRVFSSIRGSLLMGFEFLAMIRDTA